MKKLIFLLIAGILFLSACSPSGSDSSSDDTETDSNKVTIWAWDPNFNIAALNMAKEIYEKENPEVEVEIIENAQDDIVQKLNTGLSSGTSKGLPSIVLIEDYRAQSFLQAYPDAFYEMSGAFNTEDFAEYKIAPTSIDGKQYGLPFDSGVTGLYVRTDYLEEAGYTMEDLQGLDWQQYIEIGKKVKETTGKDMITLDPNDLGIVRLMIQTAGAWYLEEDGVTPSLAGNKALKEAFEIYKEMMDADIVKPNSDWSQFVANFNSGDVASVPTGNWITPSIKAETSQSGKWAVAPIPKLSTEGAVNASNLGGSSWYVLNGDSAEQAADFLGKTFGSSTELYQQLVTDIGAIGTYKPAAGGEAYEKEDEFFSGQKIISDFAGWTEEITGLNYGMHTYAIEDILIVEMQNYLNGKSIDDVLNDAQAQAEAQLK
ncbi:extracellular solute-binding protein [Domibacillus sp. A3M-37]|uniref:ABC transporter substrate-binding protein n=1 Tax=Domibacillus sp. A3M-37 TaxID=2962037 RepID=UPI0020B6F336|nr:extracellular solute-binding protein [Domibacillus sp. A3M-37]MCP3762220.1 extracellular solute-binding protein [Domibacillus sp. A3M-37]